MRRARVCEAIILVAGIVIVLGGLAHTFIGWPALRSEMRSQSVTPDLMRGASIGWIFGGTAMGVLGFLVIMSARMLRAGVGFARLVAATVGVFYALFGLGASMAVFPGLHFVPFVVIGGALLGGAASWRREAP